MADIYSKPGSISRLALSWCTNENFCRMLFFFCDINHDRLTSHESLFSEAFGNEQGNKNRLLNILMNLRKCVDHPYLFNGEMCSVMKWMLNKILVMSKHVLHFNVPLLFVRGGTGAFRDGGASRWSQWETLPFGQHADLSSQRVSTCCWAPPGGSLGSCLTFFFLSLFMFAGEGATGSCCSLRWQGCWTYFRITWSTEVKRGVPWLCNTLTVNG